MDHQPAQPSHHRNSHSEWCSYQSGDEQLPGTAAQQRYWVLLEHPGAWSHDILDGHAFGAELTDQLRAHLDRAAARLLLIRRPGRDGQHIQRRRVYFVDSAPEQRSIRTVDVETAADLLRLDLHTGRSVDATLPAPRQMAGPVVLVCTHGKRDQCCAVRGRPVAAQLSAELDAELAATDPQSRVWETSHTGGHRFAPAMVLMGAGLTYGSVTTDHYRDAVRAVLRSEVALRGYRGRSAYSPTEQVAEIAVRRHLHPELPPGAYGAAIDCLSVHSVPSSDETTSTVAVRHRDGRSWNVAMRRRELPPRPTSCGAAPKPAATWDVVDIAARDIR